MSNKINVNSNVNQAIKGKFVEREIYSNVNTMVEYIIKKSCEDSEAPFSYDDIENMYIDNSDKIKELESQIEELENEIADDEHLDNCLLSDRQKQIDNLNDEIEQLKSEQEDPQEVFTWYVVSSWLCAKLKEKGEVVLSDENIWGRGTFGQAILLDGVISEICLEMEILEGQKNEWKV